jgi:hypothetical protein
MLLVVRMQFNPCLTGLGIDKPMPTLRTKYGSTLRNNSVLIPPNLR